MTGFSLSKNLQLFIEYIHQKSGLQINTYEQLYNWSIEKNSDFQLYLWDFIVMKTSENYLVRPYLGNAVSFLKIAFKPEDTICFEAGVSGFAPVSARSLFEAVSKRVLELSGLNATGRDIYLNEKPNTLDSLVDFLSCIELGVKWISIPGASGVLIKEKIETVLQQLGFGYITETAEQKLMRKSASAFVPVGQYLTSDLIILTSGTTAYPKLIFHSLSSWTNQHKEQLLHLDLQKGDRILIVTEPGWMMWNWMISSLFLGIVPILASAQFMMLNARRNMEFQLEKIALFGASSYFYNSFLNFPRNQLPHADKFLITGSQPGSSIYEKLSQAGLNSIFNVSGGTEINGCIFIETPDHQKVASCFQSVGLGIELVTDVNLEEQPLMIKSKNFNLPKAIVTLLAEDLTEKYVNKENFEYTHGDFYIKSQRGYAISGRSELIFKIRDERISLEMFTRYLNAEGLNEVVAVPVQVRETGEFVLLYKTDGFVDEEVITKRIKIQFGVNYVPLIFVKLDSIKTTPSGKTDHFHYRTALSVKKFDSVKKLLEAIQQCLQ